MRKIMSWLCAWLERKLYDVPTYEELDRQCLMQKLHIETLQNEIADVRDGGF